MASTSNTTATQRDAPRAEVARTAGGRRFRRAGGVARPAAAAHPGAWRTGSPAPSGRGAGAERVDRRQGCTLAMEQKR
ncbi:MAG: hypothetical protein RLZZ117_661 [Cyanobacteriota bacterium]|jgi:hypothetical protein